MVSYLVTQVARGLNLVYCNRSLIESSQEFLSVASGLGSGRQASLPPCHATRQQAGRRYNPVIYNLLDRENNIRLSVQQVEESPTLSTYVNRGQNSLKHPATLHEV